MSEQQWAVRITAPGFTERRFGPLTFRHQAEAAATSLTMQAQYTTSPADVRHEAVPFDPAFSHDEPPSLDPWEIDSSMADTIDLPATWPDTYAALLAFHGEAGRKCWETAGFIADSLADVEETQREARGRE